MFLFKHDSDMASPSNKLVLKSTTKMSLNERFTAYRTEVNSATNSFRQKMQIQRQASSANYRLAQQMAQRPTVIAALRLKKRSLQQRLGRRQQSAGTNVKARLNFAAKRLNNNSSNNIRSRLGAIRGRNFANRGNFRPGTSPLLRGRLGNNNRPFNNNLNTFNQRMNFRKRGGFQGGNRQPRNNRVNLRGARGGLTARGQGGRGGFRGRGGAGRWGKNADGPVPSKQELDNQLDAYMAETKGSFDSHLM